MEMSGRIKFVGLLFVLGFVFIGIRLFTIQQVTGEQYSEAAALQRFKNVELYSERGDILDRNGIRLTNRENETSVLLQPVTLAGQESLQRMIASLLKISYEELNKKVQSNQLPFTLPVGENQAEAIRDSGIEGISVVEFPKRNGSTTLAAHILGYVGEKGKEGLAGVEKAYQTSLSRGGGLYAGVIADAGNTIMSQFGYRVYDTTADTRLNVMLTIDYHMQKIVEETMDRMVTEGAVVIVDILTGKVLAMASRPNFDPASVNDYLSDPSQALFNRALGAYTPGSIFKIITVAAALESGISPETTFDCPGYVQLGDKLMKCTSYLTGGHGTVNMAQGFAKSCNAYFIQLGLKVGRNNLVDMADKFGLGSKTGIYLQGLDEALGRLPNTMGPASDGETANLSIGQGDLLVSPLQAANMTAIIANGGIRNRLTLVEAIVNDKGQRIRNIGESSWERVISKETAASLQGMMQMTVQSGTGSLANIRGHGGSAGKTGSAETGWLEDDRAIIHAWFSGYFPVNSPRYAMCVFIEDGKSGGSSAAPVFAEISARIMDEGF